EADHQLARKRPRLAAEVVHVLDLDARLLEHLAPHGLLEGLARLDEAGEHAVERPVEPGAPGEQHAVAVLDEHDHCRRDPRVGRGGAWWAWPGELRAGS